MARQRILPPGMIKRGKVYYAQFEKSGRRIRKRLSADFSVACEALNQLRARADRGDFGIVDNAYSWDELKAEFLRWAKQAVRNPRDYERDLNRFESYCRVGSIRQIDQAYVIGFREWRRAHAVGSVAGKEWKRAAGKTVSERTINREVGTLTNMLNKALEWGRIGSNPLAGLKALEHGDARKQRRSLSSEEVLSILAEAPDYLKPVLRLFSVAAIRRDELVELRFSDVDFERRCIVIRATVAKSKKAREIQLDDGTIAMLDRLRAAAKFRQPVAGYEKSFSREHVFVSGANTPLRNNLLRAFYAVCKRAGIQGGHQGGSVDLHSLRVTSASLMLENGASPKAVQAILGHSTLALTMNVYAKATEKAKRDAVSALPFLAPTPKEGVISMQNHPRTAPSVADAPKPVGLQAVAN